MGDFKAAFEQPSHHGGDFIVTLVSVVPRKHALFVAKSYMSDAGEQWFRRMTVASFLSSDCFLTADEVEHAVAAFNRREWEYFTSPDEYEGWELIVMKKITRTLKPDSGS